MNRFFISCVIVSFCLIAISGSVRCAYSRETDPYYVRELAGITKQGVEAQSILGSGWVSHTERITSLMGWTGKVGGYAITFSNPNLLSNRVPVSFRIIRSGSNSHLIQSSESNADQLLSIVGFNYWYCNPGNYQAAYPKEWERTLEKLCDFFELPRAVFGVFCQLEGGAKVIPSGKPVPIYARLTKFRANEPCNEKLPNDWPRYLVVTGPYGNQLPLRTPAEIELYKSRRLRDPDAAYASQWGEDIAQTFDMSGPGIYKIRLRCPIENDNDTVMVSQEIKIRVVPLDFVQLTLRRLNGGDNVIVGNVIPVEMDLIIKEGSLDQFEEMTICYSAMKKASPSMPYGDLYGARDVKMNESIRGIPKNIRDGQYRMRFDFAAGLWNYAHSSVGPKNSIWIFVKTGEDWLLWVRVNVTLEGRRMDLATNQIPIHLAE